MLRSSTHTANDLFIHVSAGGQDSVPNNEMACCFTVLS
jgi:hypothetical protein